MELFNHRGVGVSRITLMKNISPQKILNSPNFEAHPPSCLVCHRHYGSLMNQNSLNLGHKAYEIWVELWGHEARRNRKNDVSNLMELHGSWVVKQANYRPRVAMAIRQAAGGGSAGTAHYVKPFDSMNKLASTDIHESWNDDFTKQWQAETLSSQLSACAEYLFESSSAVRCLT